MEVLLPLGLPGPLAGVASEVKAVAAVFPLPFGLPGPRFAFVSVVPSVGAFVGPLVAVPLVAAVARVARIIS